MNSELVKQVKTKFENRFSKKPVLVFSPGRINLIGGHTDYNDGFVLPAAINKGIVAATQHSNKHFSSIIALDLNEQLDFSLKNIKPIKSGGWKNYVLGVLAEIRKKGKILTNFNLVFGGDIPIGAGLSSSAALENSIVFCLNTLFKLSFTKKEMITISQQAEHNYAGVKCGIMDQYASMFGLKNHALLLDCRTIESKPININFNDYVLLLINTNVKHNLSESAYNKQRLVCEKIAALLNISALRDATIDGLLKIKKHLKDTDYQIAKYIIEENKRVVKASKALRDKNILSFGKLLFQSHHGLQHQYKVSCPELDFLVNKAKENPNIIGARIMGGGFGGCSINLIKKDTVEEYSNVIQDDFFNKFKQHCSIYRIHLTDGTQLIY